MNKAWPALITEKISKKMNSRGSCLNSFNVEGGFKGKHENENDTDFVDEYSLDKILNKT